ncbi:MAG: acyl-ACP--UDP-N-acetylglucosamine O-acyltransferase [Candidatus Omnitrophica bacterium]|nr:acyl-ACP--UDP-N-acetylglucosamine O-acyltransferase [Candidatus Omnitrophota bacterium]
MIHSTAVVSKKAKIAQNVEVGPYSVIEDNVEIKEGTKIGPFCSISGYTTIGKNNQIFSNVVIGSIPQDLKYKGEKTLLIIGDNNRIREFVTMNPGTGENGKTEIGSGNLIMAYAHIAHDCKIGNNVVVANVGTLAGHVTIGDSAILGGLAAIHQFVRVGKLSIIGGGSKVTQDIPPFSMCDGHPARVRGLNLEGLKRAGYSTQDRMALKKYFRILFLSKHPISKAIEILNPEKAKNKDLDMLVDFILNSKRGICL